MKLTKDDNPSPWQEAMWAIESAYDSDGFYFEEALGGDLVKKAIFPKLWEKITADYKKNQEDAENWNNTNLNLDEFDRLQNLEKRLKKRIEECQYMGTVTTPNPNGDDFDISLEVKQELQKILEGKE